MQYLASSILVLAWPILFSNRIRARHHRVHRWTGRVYVSAAERDQVLRFAPDGAFQVALGAGGADPGRFGAPSGLAVAGGRLYVADSQNRRIQVFAILGDRS